MCTFVMVAIPESKTASTLELKFPRSFHIAQGPTVGPDRPLPEGYNGFSLVQGEGCSCGLFFDPDSPEEKAHDESRRLSKLQKSYEKRGWSEAKIERALRDSGQASGTLEFGIEKAQLETLEGLEHHLREAARRSKGGLYLWWHDVDETDYRPDPVPKRRKAEALKLRPSSHPIELLIHYV